MEMTVADLQALLSVKQVAEMFDVPARVVRKAAKASPPTIPGVVEVLGKCGFDPDKVSSWTPPEPGTRVVGASRDDGRQRYRIYLTPGEAAKLLAEGHEISDPRQAAKERRAAKKVAQGDGSDVPQPDVESTDDNPFADFDV